MHLLSNWTHKSVLQKTDLSKSSLLLNQSSLLIEITKGIRWVKIVIGILDLETGREPVFYVVRYALQVDQSLIYLHFYILKSDLTKKLTGYRLIGSM